MCRTSPGAGTCSRSKARQRDTRFAGSFPSHPLKRALARALRFPGAARAAPTSIVFRRPRARPLLEWLCAFGEPGPACTAVMARSWRPGGAAIVYRFRNGPAPDVIAKVGGRADSEARALRELGQSARETLVDVPVPLGSRDLAGQPVLIETAIGGSPAPSLSSAHRLGPKSSFEPLLDGSAAGIPSRSVGDDSKRRTLRIRARAGQEPGAAPREW